MRERDEEIPDICIIIIVIEPCMDIPNCLTGEEIRLAMMSDEYIGREWIAVIDCTAMKCRKMIPPVVLKDKALK